MDSSADSNNRFRTVTSCPACGRPLAPMEDSWTPRLELGCHGCGRVYHVGEEREREDGEWVVIGR